MNTGIYAKNVINSDFTNQNTTGLLLDYQCLYSGELEHKQRHETLKSNLLPYLWNKAKFYYINTLR